MLETKIAFFLPWIIKENCFKIDVEEIYKYFSNFDFMDSS